MEEGKVKANLSLEPDVKTRGHFVARSLGLSFSNYCKAFILLPFNEQKAFLLPEGSGEALLDKVKTICSRH